MQLRNGFAKWKENGFKKHWIRQMERKWNQKNIGFAKWKNSGMNMDLPNNEMCRLKKKWIPRNNPSAKWNYE